MRLPVDTSAVSFVTAAPAEPAVDFDTKVDWPSTVTCRQPQTFR
jgi:hypothetical protein